MATGSSEIAQALSEEAFAIGQRAVRSDTANTVARTALRFSASEPRLRELLKLIDDLDRSSDTIEQTLDSFRVAPSGHSPASFSAIRSQLASLADLRKATLTQIQQAFLSTVNSSIPRHFRSRLCRPCCNPTRPYSRICRASRTITFGASRAKVFPGGGSSCPRSNLARSWRRFAQASI